MAQNPSLGCRWPPRECLSVLQGCNSWELTRVTDTSIRADNRIPRELLLLEKEMGDWQGHVSQS